MVEAARMPQPGRKRMGWRRSNALKQPLRRTKVVISCGRFVCGSGTKSIRTRTNVNNIATKGALESRSRVLWGGRPGGCGLSDSVGTDLDFLLVERDALNNI